MARWDRNWQGAVQGYSGRRLHRSPRRGGPIQGGNAALSDGRSAPLNRTVGRDPLVSRPTGIGCLATGSRGASTGRLVNAPASDDSASDDRGCDGVSQPWGTQRFLFPCRLRRPTAVAMAGSELQVAVTVSLGMLAGSEVLYIDELRESRRGQYAIDVVMGPGTRQPVYCIAAGKALLARLPAAGQREVIVNLTLRQVTPSTLTSTKAFRVELARIAAAGGVAIDDEESLAGRRALATTVLDSDRRPVAAVEVAVPATAYTIGELVEHVGPVVSETVGQIGAALGH